MGGEIISGLGDVAPATVIKGSGSTYVVVSKAKEFVKSKENHAKFLDLDDQITRNNFIIQFCSYISPDEKEISRINLFYRLLEHANSFNNFEAENIRLRNPQDYCNFAQRQGLGFDIAPELPENKFLDCSDPVKLLDEEIALCDKLNEYEIFLERLYNAYKTKKEGMSKSSRKV